MSLIVEDGSIVANAESYITVTNAGLYHTARGNAPWATITTAQAEEALRRGTDYMMQVYRMRWKGYRKSGLQVLDWPRSYVYREPFVQGAIGAYPYLVSDITVPLEVQNALCELALRAAAGELISDLSRGVHSETVGPIAIVYDERDPQYTRYRQIDLMLSPYTQSSSVNVGLRRAMG